jgi:hypothetical protein
VVRIAIAVAAALGAAGLAIGIWNAQRFDRQVESLRSNTEKQQQAVSKLRSELESERTLRATREAATAASADAAAARRHDKTCVAGVPANPDSQGVIAFPNRAGARLLMSAIDLNEPKEVKDDLIRLNGGIFVKTGTRCRVVDVEDRIADVFLLNDDGSRGKRVWMYDEWRRGPSK